MITKSGSELMSAADPFRVSSLARFFKPMGRAGVKAIRFLGNTGIAGVKATGKGIQNLTDAVVRRPSRSVPLLAAGLGGYKFFSNLSHNAAYVDPTYPVPVDRRFL